MWIVTMEAPRARELFPTSRAKNSVLSNARSADRLLCKTAADPTRRLRPGGNDEIPAAGLRERGEVQPADPERGGGPGEEVRCVRRRAPRHRPGPGRREPVLGLEEPALAGRQAR